MKKFGVNDIKVLMVIVDAEESVTDLYSVNIPFSSKTATSRKFELVGVTSIVYVISFTK